MDFDDSSSDDDQPVVPRPNTAKQTGGRGGGLPPRPSAPGPGAHRPLNPPPTDSEEEEVEEEAVSHPGGGRAPAHPMTAQHQKHHHEEEEEEEEKPHEGPLSGTLLERRSNYVSISRAPFESGAVIIKSLTFPTQTDRSTQEIQQAIETYADTIAKHFHALSKNTSAAGVQVVPLIDILVNETHEADHLQILSECIGGGSLEDALAHVTLDSYRIRAITLSLVSIIDKLHSSNIVHGNLKSSNILFIEDELILTDFYNVSGTPLSLSQDFTYYPPEICEEYRQKFGDVTDLGDLVCEFMEDPITMNKAVDVWAVGMIVLEMALGRAPCRLKVPSEISVMCRGKGLSDLIKTHCVDCSTGMVEFITTCLCADPSRRPLTTTLLAHPWLSMVHPKVMGTQEVIKALAHESVAQTSVFTSQTSHHLQTNAALFRNAVFSLREGKKSPFGGTKPNDIYVTKEANVTINAGSQPVGDVFVYDVAHGHVFIAERCRRVYLKNCLESEVILGPCDALIVDGVSECQIVVAAKDIKIRNCSNVQFMCYSMNPVDIDEISEAKCQFGPYLSSFQGITSMWNEAHLGSLVCNVAAGPYRGQHELLLHDVLSGIRITSCDFPYAIHPTASSCEVSIRNVKNVFVCYCENETSYLSPIEYLPLIVENTHDSDVWLLNNVPVCIVTKCTKTRVVLGPVLDFTVIEDCSDCEIHVPCFGEVTLVNCERCVVHAYVMKPINLLKCKDVSVGPFVVAIPELDEMLESIGVDEENLPDNLYDQVQALEGGLRRPGGRVNSLTHQVLLPEEVTGLKIVLEGLVEPSPILFPEELSGDVASLTPKPGTTFYINLDGIELTRAFGTVPNMDVVVENISTGKIILLDGVKSLTVRKCVATEVQIVVAAAGSVLIEDCSHVTIFVTTKSVTLRNCHHVTCQIHTNTAPVLEGCTDVLLLQFDFKTPHLLQALSNAGVDPSINCVGDISPNLEDFILPIVGSLSEFRMLPLAQGHFERLGGEESVQQLPNQNLKMSGATCTRKTAMSALEKLLSEKLTKHVTGESPKTKQASPAVSPVKAAVTTAEQHSIQPTLAPPSESHSAQSGVPVRSNFDDSSSEDEDNKQSAQKQPLETPAAKPASPPKVVGNPLQAATAPQQSNNVAKFDDSSSDEKEKETKGP
eukprot:PhF_6_TR10441/c0_g1_i3/m.16518